ncbi:MAG: UDP-N-acetylmuramate dehydrogenase, partial [Proteobacteria bacterium]|nr:UDP-N-acetylmuramate dehydrogenase [Pseudomonadota bacterium]
MNALTHPATLQDRLPQVRGSYEPDAALGEKTWFRTGGCAEVLFKPEDYDDLAAFMAAVPGDIPVTVVGVGSNLLIRDGGVTGVVVRMGKAMAEISIQGDLVSAGAGALGVTIAAKAMEAGLGGLEFLKGVPGSVGGALCMNAGAYGCEVADIFVEATIIDRAGVLRQLNADHMKFGYRHSEVPEGCIFTAAVFRGQRTDQAAIYTRMKGIMDAREQSQPLRTRTGGSTFKNPDIEDSGRKAWQLIDEAGCRGLTVGGAMVSEKHCNFLINTGDATAADLENLGDEVRSRV